MNNFADAWFITDLEIPSKYTQLSEGDPYFFDFQKKQENREAYIAHRAKYVEKFPEFWRLLEIMEISLQTYRSEFDRLSNLSVGFLRSAEINNFERWHETSHQKWNRIVLTHKQVPQEFYTSLLGIAHKIRNEYFEQPPFFDPILSNQHGHATLYEILSSYPRIDVTNRQLREHLMPIGIQELLKRNPWQKHRWYYTINGDRFSPQACATKMLNQILIILSLEDEIPNPQEDSTIVRINPKVFFEGFEEAVRLSMLLAKKEYSQILSVLQTTKTRVGRLEDNDFETFKPYYAHLAKMFYLYHTYDSTRLGLQRKGYQNLVRFFQATMGMTQTKVQQEIWELTCSEVEAMKAYFQQSLLDKLTDPLY